MIHTILISSIINEGLYYEIANELNIAVNNKEYKTLNYSRLGFREIRLINTSRKGFNPYYGIEVLLNPNVLIQGREVITPISHLDLQRVSETFNQKFREIMRLRSIYEQIQPFNSWSCKRIDYCVDIRLSNAEEYMKLICRADKPSEHYKYKSYSKKDRLDIQSEQVGIISDVNDGTETYTGASIERHNTDMDSLYLYSESVNVNFYNKAAELRNRMHEEHSNVTPELIEEAEGIIRFEVQCKSGKITDIKEIFQLPDRSTEHYLSLNIAREIILWYYDHTIGEQDYYSLYEARKIVNQQGELSTKMKGVLCNILNLNAKAKRITTAREQYTSEQGVKPNGSKRVLHGSERTYNRNINILRNLGINPVTVPRGWKKVRMNNLRELIVNAFEQ
jgi:hypothetical protein